MFNVRDLVCKVKVSKKTPYTLFYDGKIYYFDCQACKETFKSNPQQFVKGKHPTGLLGWVARGSKDVPKSCHEIKK